MKMLLVRIGNSVGLRLSKALLKQSGLCGEVELTVSRQCIVIRPARHPREGWKEAFTKAGAGKEELLVPDNLENDGDRDEWHW